jgi:hypothetical protein
MSRIVVIQPTELSDKVAFKTIEVKVSNDQVTFKAGTVMQFQYPWSIKDTASIPLVNWTFGLSLDAAMEGLILSAYEIRGDLFYGVIFNPGLTPVTLKQGSILLVARAHEEVTFRQSTPPAGSMPAPKPATSRKKRTRR